RSYAHSSLPCLFFLYQAAPTEVYTLSLHDALPILRLVLLDGYRPDVKVIQLRSDQPFDQPIVDVLLDIRSASGQQRYQVSLLAQDRKSTRLNSSHVKISYAVFCLKKKKHDNTLTSE